MHYGVLEYQVIKKMEVSIEFLGAAVCVIFMIYYVIFMIVQIRTRTLMVGVLPKREIHSDETLRDSNPNIKLGKKYHQKREIKKRKLDVLRRNDFWMVIFSEVLLLMYMIREFIKYFILG